MKIHVVTVAYNLPHSTLKLFMSLNSDKGHEVHTHLFLHNAQNEAVVAVCEDLARTGEVTYYPYGTNRGLSKSWNEGILNAYGAGADVVIVVNDDCEFTAGDLDKLAECAVRHRENHFISCWGWNHHHQKRMPLAYSCFAINPIAIEQIGMFDENIVPIYTEDCDYAYRAKLLGLNEVYVADTNVDHQGSAAIHTDHQLRAQNGITHAANMAYYIRKWGGGPDRERFTNPFGDQRFGLYIDPAMREAPYPGYNRTVDEIVGLVKI